ncbi:enoyl-CoA hydratase/isomerase family protein [Rhodococcoides fascians]|uniref:enoyl-CoA hydratase/isomerase family protein n=1 Tax=Rhodococcoides fascians TaxID=1828 RepID=UPI00056847F8|nr:enoyl-CoA hydratase-related protein [Rhodococcus fascians]
MNDSAVLLEERLDHVVLLTINRPKSMNAIDPVLATSLRDAWTRLLDDDSAWVVVLTASGERAFSAGYDLKTPQPSGSFAGSFLGGSSASASFNVPIGYVKPVICAVNGLALGGGMELMMSTDIQIASTEAFFGLPEAKIGSIPGAGGTQRIERFLPRSVARRLALTGERLDAESALRLGLVSELVDPAEIRSRAIEIAQQICQNAPLAVRAIKKSLDASDALSLEDGLAYEQMLWGSLRDSEDRIEGRRAFAEKRAPLYRAR